MDISQKPTQTARLILASIGRRLPANRQNNWKLDSPRRVPNLAYLVSERIFLGCPSPRQSSPPTPLACAPSPPRSSPCGASARAPALWNRAAPPPWLWICAAPKQSGGPCPPRGGAAPLALSSTRPSKQASSIQKQSSEHRWFHVPPDLRMLVCRCRV